MMKTKKTRQFNIDPDGVPITVDITEFPVGASLFVPCINTTQAKRQIRTRAKNVRLTFDIRIEGKKLGLRVWRIA
jgi:hypothetical protein